MDNHRLIYISKYAIVLLVWLIYGVTSTASYAQNAYRTDLLKLIADKCNLHQKLDSIPDGEYIHCAQFRNLPITAIVENKRVTHIGYSIFSPEQRAGFGKVVCNFIERYLLELDIPTRDNVSATQRMIEDRVKMVKGKLDFQRLCQLSKDSSVFVNLQTINDKEYIMGWRRDSVWQQIISIPIEYDLLFGTNMDERERRLLEELTMARYVKDSLMVDKNTKIRKAWQDNYYTVKGGAYLLPNLNANQYLWKDEKEKFRAIYNKTYPIESLANLFTSNLVDNDFNLEIRLRKYGFKTDTLRVPLQQWISYCQQTGCKAYFGIIDLNPEGNAVCLLIMHNSSLGYNHIMKITFPMVLFEKRNGNVPAKLNSYVNYTRIKNLFADYNDIKL